MTNGEPTTSMDTLADPTASIAAIMQALTRIKEEQPDRPEVAIGVSSNVVVELLGVFLRRHGAIAGVDLKVVSGDYDDLLGDVERFREAGVDDLLILPFFDNLLPAFEAQVGHLSDEMVNGKCEEFTGRLHLALEGAREFRTVYLCTFHRMSAPVGDAGPDRIQESLERFDAAMRRQAEGFPNVRLVELGAALTSVGRAAAFDGRFYARARAPYTAAFLDEMARRISTGSRGFGSYFKKALVLDADGTLWGGILGEDLIEGIALDPFEYPGNVFWAVQNQLASLEKQGVLLCLCSKNNPEDVEQMLEKHPNSVLRTEHFAARRVNWQDKVANLREIAEELNIGLDSLIFLDDSPFECAAVREQLPEVRTIMVPETLPDYLDVIRKIGEVMIAGGVSGESTSKTDQYRHQDTLRSQRARFDSQEEYLRSLELQVELSRDDPERVARVSELTQKSNQFNLTTRRYSEGEIAGLMEDVDHAVYALRVGDRFGDHGLTGVLIAAYEGDELRIDSFLLSCRVLGRGVEFAPWGLVSEDARARGCTRIAAEFLPTAKNMQVEDFYDRLGLIPGEMREGGGRCYTLGLDDFAPASQNWVEVSRAR